MCSRNGFCVVIVLIFDFCLYSRRLNYIVLLEFYFIYFLVGRRAVY